MQDDNHEIMPAREIALRALCLFAVWLINTPTPRDEVLLWIENNRLWDKLSPNETKFIKCETPNRIQKINFSWHIERLYVLAWALGEVDEMLPADKQGTIAEFQKAISPLNADTSKRYLNLATRRDEKEIWDAADKIEALNWKARNTIITNVQPDEPVDSEIIQERHHAINWILWGNEELWDDVNTDT